MFPNQLSPIDQTNSATNSATIGSTKRHNKENETDGQISRKLSKNIKSPNEQQPSDGTVLGRRRLRSPIQRSNAVILEKPPLLSGQEELKVDSVHFKSPLPKRKKLLEQPREITDRVKEIASPPREFKLETPTSSEGPIIIDSDSDAEEDEQQSIFQKNLDCVTESNPSQIGFDCSNQNYSCKKNFLMECVLTDSRTKKKFLLKMSLQEKIEIIEIP